MKLARFLLRSAGQIASRRRISGGGAQLRSLFILAVVFYAGLCFPPGVSAQHEAAVFDSATVFYERGEYGNAIEQYNLLLNQGYDDPVIWYNLGNAYYKANQLGRSIKAYLRAQRRAPRDPDIAANLQFVQLYTVDKMERPGRLFFLGWLDYFSARYTLGEWLITAGIMCLILSSLAGLAIWRNQAGRAAWSWLGLGWCIWLLVLSGTARRYHDVYLQERGVVVVAETDVRGGPGDDYTLQFTGHNGLLLSIDRAESGWYLVTFVNGVKGWVTAEAIERI